MKGFRRSACTKQLNLNCPIYSANIIPFSADIQKDPSIAEGVVYFDYIIPGTNEFRERFREKFKLQPNFASAQAYDAVFLIKEAIEECGQRADEILKCLKKSDYQGISGRIRFNTGGVIASASGNTYLMHVKNGQFQKLEASSATQQNVGN